MNSTIHISGKILGKTRPLFRDWAIPLPENLLLQLENVRFQDSHALIAGDLGNYSVHLGGGIVHRQTGEVLCIIPVHSQHQGRLFLPFADDDPKTAEVISKVILLAKDKEIKDPTIKEQIL